MVLVHKEMLEPTLAVIVITSIMIFIGLFDTLILFQIENIFELLIKYILIQSLAIVCAVYLVNNLQ